VDVFFRYALRRGREGIIRSSVRIAYGTDGGIDYDTAENMTIWKRSIVTDELNRINAEAKRNMK